MVIHYKLMEACLVINYEVLFENSKDGKMDWTHRVNQCNPLFCELGWLLQPVNPFDPSCVTIQESGSGWSTHKLVSFLKKNTILHMFNYLLFNVYMFLVSG